jgi:uncharacterized membrane protein
MAHADIILPVETSHLPKVRTIGLADLKQALARGFDDFRAMPTHVVFLSLLYPLVGLALGSATFGYDLVPLLYPLVAGFALVGPFAAIGLYELSRRREMHLDTSWQHAFDIVHSPSLWSIAALGALLVMIFGVWMAVANAIYVANFGDQPVLSVTAFLRQVFTTPEGLNLIVLGNAVGFLFAVLTFILSVVSFPLLLDRNVGAAVAVATSLRAVARNPLIMAVWGLILACGLILGSAPLFFGLAVVMPILGHASWHLYRRVVEPDGEARPDYHPRARPPRYAADFPVALFVPSGSAPAAGEDQGNAPENRKRP